MTILVASGKSLKLQKISDHYYFNDAFGSNELATMSAGRELLKKGFSIKDFTIGCDDVTYVLKGSMKIVSDGKTYVAHEGDLVHMTKGSKMTHTTDEDCEAIYVTFPTLREPGTPGGIPSDV